MPGSGPHPTHLLLRVRTILAGIQSKARPISVHSNQRARLHHLRTQPRRYLVAELVGDRSQSPDCDSNAPLSIARTQARKPWGVL